MVLTYLNHKQDFELKNVLLFLDTVLHHQKSSRKTLKTSGLWSYLSVTVVFENRYLRTFRKVTSQVTLYKYVSFRSYVDTLDMPISV